jgi:hypothetical protein
MESESESSLFGLNIDEQASATLRTATQWGRVLSILGFVLGGLVLILGFIFYSRLTGYYRGQGNEYLASPMQKLALRYLIICIVFAGVLMTGAVFMLNFSNRTVSGLDSQDQYLLNSGLSAFKGGIVFWSIVFIVFIVLMSLGIMGLASVSFFN